MSAGFSPTGGPRASPLMQHRPQASPCPHPLSCSPRPHSSSIYLVTPKPSHIWSNPGPTTAIPMMRSYLRISLPSSVIVLPAPDMVAG